MLLSITEFFGHFHPLLVHLPLGILLIAIIVSWLSDKPKYASWKPVVPFLLISGAVCALLSSITGYLLSISDDYDKSLVSWHMWMGIITTMLALMLYAKEKNPLFPVSRILLLIALLLSLFITGHLGGSLTHGSDYLTKPLKSSFSSDTVAIKKIANVQEALVFQDVVVPIFQSKCYNCHGSEKQKGKLRLDDSAHIFKGGKDGLVIKPGNAAISLLIKRILLPMDDDDHMPPKEKAQLSDQQIALLQWWINNNASCSQKVKELKQNDDVKGALLALQNATPATPLFQKLPNINAADALAVESLRKSGIVIMPLAANTNFLTASFINHPQLTQQDITDLQKTTEQLYFLRLSGANINDQLLTTISKCSNLQTLFLDNTNITDASLTQLQALKKLQSINLVNTSVTAKGLQQLSRLPQLKEIFIYKTKISSADWPSLRNAFPHAGIDTGGYQVPTLESDTTTVKEKKNY